MLNRVKLALRMKTSAFDGEIQDLIDGAKADLALSGIDTTNQRDPLIVRAVVTYCRLHFGDPDEYDRLKASYDEQKAQLQMACYYWL